MGDDQKIWFIYLTDHHEGPFTPAEIAEKATQGLVTGQSLVWKDGMPEWVALETVPELQSALGAGSAPAEAPASPAPAAEGAPASGGEGDFSLAQLLAASQSKDAAAESPSVAVETPVQMAAPAQEPASAPGSSLSALAALSSASTSSAPEPSPHDEVWTLKIGGQVTGLHSLERLIQLANEGEVPADAMLWRSGWTDFQSVTAVPQVASARKPKRAGVTKTGLVARPGGARTGLAPIVPGANVGDDDATDPSIPVEEAPKGFMAKVKGFLQRKQKAGAAPAAAKAGKTAVIAKTKKVSVGLSGGFKKALTGVLVLALLGGGGAAYFLFFSSPLPSDLDVTPADFERMKEAVKGDPAQPAMVAALARGTEDNPADDTAPKFYVASNLPEGTPVTMTIEGRLGTLVNKLRFEKSFSATVNSQKLAVFEEVKDEGKPIPMGEYLVKFSAEGAAALEETRFLGGKKGAVYDRRLKQYKDKLQESYDKEMAELRQFIETLKSLQGEVSRKIAEYKAGVSNPALRARIVYDWKTYSQSFFGLASQFDTKVKERMSANEEKYHPRTYQDVASTLSQLQQLVQLHGSRVEGATPPSNPDELEGLIQASVIGLEQWLASAVVKGPFDALNEAKTVPASATAPATAPAAVP